MRASTWEERLRRSCEPCGCLSLQEGREGSRSKSQATEYRPWILRVRPHTGRRSPLKGPLKDPRSKSHQAHVFWPELVCTLCATCYSSARPGGSVSSGHRKHQQKQQPSDSDWAVRGKQREASDGEITHTQNNKDLGRLIPARTKWEKSQQKSMAAVNTDS